MCASSEIRDLTNWESPNTVPPVPKTKRKSFMEGGYGRFGDGVLEEGSSEGIFRFLNRNESVVYGYQV